MITVEEKGAKSIRPTVDRKAKSQLTREAGYTTAIV